MIGRFFSSIFIFTLRVLTLDGLVEWHRFPRVLGMLGVIRLLAYRSMLRRQNLYDTSAGMSKDLPDPSGDYLTARMPGGRFNDLDDPNMGSAGARFGRNFPLDRVHPESAAELLTPSPRTVSLELMTRHTFTPATILNVLAAAWIQFMVHTWVNHGGIAPDEPIEIPLEEDDPWPEKPMRIQRTPPDPTRSPSEDNLPPTFVNTVTHWWDGSQIYGSNAEEVAELRSGVDGKLPIGNDGLLPLDPTTGIDKTGFSNNYWIGLSVLHTLFTLEHNALCNMFQAEYPSWSDDELFNHARLVNTALMAKIHTVEWTPAIISHPATQYVMRASWWGILGERFHRRFGRVGRGSILSGYPGARKDHYGVPFTLTEEFVSVYRLHPLLPDDFRFRSASDNKFLQERDLIQVAGKNTREVQNQISMTDIIYSLCTSHPGAMRLHNFPRTLQQFHPQGDGDLIDLAAIDILRDRERGLPRYNEFRRLIHRPPVKSFEELTGDPALAEEIRRVYDGDIDRVDVQIGMLAEPLPRGFGFSDTAFRIFILMAGRRLTSDRFFTTDYNTRVYKKVGMNWIRDNDMTTVLRRHYPELAPSLEGVKNAFAPWPVH